MNWLRRFRDNQCLQLTMWTAGCQTQNMSSMWRCRDLTVGEGNASVQSLIMRNRGSKQSSMETKVFSELEPRTSKSRVGEEAENNIQDPDWRRRNKLKTPENEFTWKYNSDWRDTVESLLFGSLWFCAACVILDIFFSHDFFSESEIIFFFGPWFAPSVCFDLGIHYPSAFLSLHQSPPQ